MERKLAKRALKYAQISQRSRLIEEANKVPNKISLARGDPDLDTPVHIIEAGKEALDKGYTHYTPWAGLPELREAIAKKESEKKKILFYPDEVLVTTGAQEAIYLIMLTFLDPGDEVIVPEPRYTPYDRMINLCGGVVVPVPCYEEDGFQVRPDLIRKAITPRTKFILIVSPNNPTGTVLSDSTVEEIAKIAKEHDLIIISDEIYSELVFDNRKAKTVAEFSEMKQNVIVVSGFSKTYSMTGWRVGYLLAPSPIIKRMSEFKYSITISAPSMSQYAALAALRGPQDCVEQARKIYQQRRDYISERLSKLKVGYHKPEGGLFLFANIKKYGMSSFDFCLKLLKEAGVFIFPGTAFGEMGEGYVRISMLRPLEELREAFDRIEVFFKKV
ncbi:pyridoxal phosphate-dependent aminotransferase, partial [Candidatus Aerophobetes bacterium]|nr:pyridoxal phosphate-dependent aminotransferase [Candidatus Aerophobetes bacterium]